MRRDGRRSTMSQQLKSGIPGTDCDPADLRSNHSNCGHAMRRDASRRPTAGVVQIIVDRFTLTYT